MLVDKLSRPTLLAGLMALAACGNDLTLPDGDDPDGGDPPAGPPTITVQAGDGQDGIVGEELEAPLTVRVASDGEPLPGQAVVFEPADESGEMTPDTAVSDLQGRATARWTLGTAPGGHAAEARLIVGGAAVQFTAHAAPGAPHALAMVSGDNQTGVPLQPLPLPLVVRVTDRFGNGVSGVTVTWSVEGGRGELSGEESTTNTAGEAQVTWSLGISLGAQRARATVEGLDGSPVDFEADIF